MRRAMRLITALGIAGVMGVGLARSPVAAAPAAPTYIGIERTIESIRQAWAAPGARVSPNADGWNALFDALLQDLRAYAKANDDTERLTALNQVYQISQALGTVNWEPAVNLREEVREWLRPRVRLAWARQRLGDTVQALPASTDPSIQANRSRWVEFVRNDLGQALRDYDAADSVSQRQAALRRIHESLGSLNQQNQNQSWQPSLELSSAVNDLFNRPNLDIAADASTVSPVFDANLVESGPITRKGYTSMVTAGPKTGFGLLPSDDGIAFYNRQTMTSATPIWDFQQQIEQDPQGRKAAKLYVFSVTTYDWSELTVTTVLRPSGLELIPSATHSIDASICSAPAPGGELGRSIAALIGMNQQKITNKVYEGALPKFQQQIPAEAAEETQERITAESAQRNADLRSKYLIGNDTAAVRNFQITNLSLRSRPEAVFVGGLFQWRGAPDQRGADAPQPPKLARTFDSGVTADIHLGSLGTSAASGFWRQFSVQFVKNLVIVTKAVPPGTPPKDAVTLRANVDFENYLKAVGDAQKAKDPRVTALRVFRPEQPPEISTDARGFLVVLIHDFQLDVPAPDPQAGGNMLGVPAKVLRIKVPLAEVAISYQVDTSSPALRVKGKIEEFNPGTNPQVIAINDDENKGTPLTRFTAAFVLSALGNKIRGQNIDVALDQLKLPGFAIHSISPLDPSGWMRVNLVRTEVGPATPAVPPPTVNAAPAGNPTPPANAAPAANTVPVATNPAAAGLR
jgi:hypothetical protein